MHYWGDDWFKEHGEHLYDAIEAVEKRIRKWARMGVCGKEKFGTWRDEYLTFWNGGIGQIFCGYRGWWGLNWWTKLLFTIDHNLIPIKRVKIEEKIVWLKVGLSNFNRMIGLVNLVNKWQARMLNKAVQITCKEYPDVIDELLVCADCYKMVKPCKWGNVDGELIHIKYWTPLNPSAKTVSFECNGVMCTAVVEEETEN